MISRIPQIRNVRRKICGQIYKSQGYLPSAIAAPGSFNRSQILFYTGLPSRKSVLPSYYGIASYLQYDADRRASSMSGTLLLIESH
jgi:hypothetical protein